MALGLTPPEVRDQRGEGGAMQSGSLPQHGAILLAENRAQLPTRLQLVQMTVWASNRLLSTVAAPRFDGAGAAHRLLLHSPASSRTGRFGRGSKNTNLSQSPYHGSSFAFATLCWEGQGLYQTPTHRFLPMSPFASKSLIFPRKAALQMCSDRFRIPIAVQQAMMFRSMPSEPDPQSPSTSKRPRDTAETSSAAIPSDLTRFIPRSVVQAKRPPPKKKTNAA
uniref:Uncharacterized protein n=1 Tax=Mesocestoides corti TaxID=53468 RepID=A0A5K3G107_MESCO